MLIQVASSPGIHGTLEVGIIVTRKAASTVSMETGDRRVDGAHGGKAAKGCPNKVFGQQKGGVKTKGEKNVQESTLMMHLI